MGAFTFPAYASVGITDDEAGAELLVVSTTWLDSEMLRIDVLNDQTGVQTSLAIRVSEYLAEGKNSPYISIQAVDLDGNQSGIIQVRNPFYNPAAVDEQEAEDEEEAAEADSEDDIERPAHLRPLTPDGSGTVVDNVTDSDGIEFFTIFTEDGNEFFLIVDRQRDTDNVYLLNTVTEEALISLAQAGGREVAPSGFGAGVPAPVHPSIPTDTPDTNGEEEAEEEPEDEPPSATASGNGNLIVIIVVAVLVGGAGYYFKIHQKKNSAHAMDSYDEDEDDSFEDDDGWDYEFDDSAEGGDVDDGEKE